MMSYPVTSLRTLVFALDLRDGTDAAAAYDAAHAVGEVWPEILRSIRTAGIVDMRIFRTDDRLVMLMDVTEKFDPEAKALADAQNPVVQRWEALMSVFQKPLPGSPPGEKWRAMHQIFRLAEHDDR